MALIQDILPSGGKREPTLQAAVKTVKQVHRATQLSRLPRNFDMLVHQRPLQPAPLRATTQPVRPKPAAARPIAQPKARPRKRSLWRRLSEFAQYPLIAALAIAAAYNSTFGQAAIGLYLLIALVVRIDSRFSFGAALLLLVSVPGFQAINLTGVSEKAAIYTYELLVAGTLQAIIELALSNRRAKSPKLPKSQSG